MSTRTEEQLFEEFHRSGDPAALSALFELTAKDLLGLALHLTTHLADAEDLVQETFVVAIESAAKFRRGASVRGWLVKTLQNRARRLHRNRQRDRNRHELSGLNSSGAATASAEPAAGDVAGQRDLRSAVHTAVASLDEPYRTVVGLHAKHGFTVNEIASALSRSMHTVRSQLNRGLERLSGRLPSQAALAAAPVSTLSGVRQEVLAHAARNPPHSATLAWGVPPGKLMVAGAAVVLLSVSLYGWFASQGQAGTVAADPAAVSAAAVAAHDAAPAVPLREEIREEAPRVDTTVADQVRYRVVHRATGEPVAGATVRFSSGAFRQMDLEVDEFERVYSYLYGHDREALYRRYGQHVETDADGVFAVGGTTAFSDMTARKGGLFGRRSEVDENVIFVEQDEQLTVRVLSAEGLPVAGVLVRVTHADGKRFSSQSHLRFSSMARTTVQGLAVIPHLQLLRAALDAQDASEVGIRVAVRAMAEQVRTVDVASLGSKVIECRLPSTGTLRVRLWDGLGHRIVPRRRDGDPRVQLGGWSMQPVGDVWEMRHVPVGEELGLIASWRGIESAAKPLKIRAAGEQREVDLRFGSGAVTMVGRATDVAGRPLGDLHLAAIFGDGGRVHLTSDADGRFVCYCPADVLPPGETQPPLVDLQVVDAQFDRVGWTRMRRPRNLSAQFAVTDVTPGAKLRLGDVVFRPAPILGRGTVHCDPPAARSRLAATKIRVRERVGEEWRDVPVSAFEWGADGAFAVFGRARGKRLRVTSRQLLQGSLAVTGLDEEFAPRDMNLRWQVTLPGQVVLDLNSDTACPPVRFVVERLGAARPVEMKSNHIVRPLSFGEQGLHVLPVLGPLVPGTYRVKILAEDGARELRVLDGVKVGADRRVRPMVETPLDLR